jgi:nucleotide-binding universal stress UspA family protein
MPGSAIRAILEAKDPYRRCAMRVLLALDGSAGADVGRTLTLNLPWPEGTRLEAIRVVEPVYDVFAMPEMTFAGPIDEVLGLNAVRQALDGDAAALARSGVSVSTRVAVGRPATVITERAQAIDADLIIMGSRGRGAIATMVLGSVSGEVSTHAPCPVLVARKPAIKRVVVALDGTSVGEHVVEAMRAFPVLREAHVEVVSIAPSSVPGPGVMLGGYGVPVEWFEESVADARRSLETTAAAAAARLGEAGYEVSWSVPEGDPAATLIEHAARTDADLIVVGPHGRTGLSRLLLGSVARNVLVHARTSVLVVRAPQPTTLDGPPPR